MREMLQTPILGTLVHCLTMSEVLELVKATKLKGGNLRVGVVNAAKLVNMKSDHLLQSDVSSSDIVLADGMAVVWASYLNTVRLPQRVAGIDLMFEILNLSNDIDLRFFLLGASPQVCTQVASNIRRDYPNAIVAGHHDGYFSDGDEAKLIDQINESKADVLFVAMSSPKKERFMSAWREQLSIPIIHGVGGSFDVYGGKVSRAPSWMQNAGLEWLYRVLQEPRRMWKRYLVTNFKFLFYLVVSKTSG